MFKQLLYEYRFKTSEKKKGEIWWKGESWNECSEKDKREQFSGEGSRKHKVEKAFSRLDKMVRISSSIRASINFLQANNILAGTPECEKCGIAMEGGIRDGAPRGQPQPYESKGYVCPTCMARKPLKHSSFLENCGQSIRMFMRCAFFYFVKNYDPDLAHREMTENALDGIGCGNSPSSVKQIYALCRERISRHQLYSIRQKKLGGPAKEVVVDFMKLPLRNKKTQKNEEWLVLGFMEREGARGGRCRAFIIPNLKVQTIAMYMSKTIAHKSVVFTPFYAETGWEFMKKFFDHRRLTSSIGEVDDYYAEKEEWIRLSGFGSMWKNLRNIDLGYIKFIEDGRHWGVPENLQMFVDEQVWRTENKTAEDKRQALALSFHCAHWKEENHPDQVQLGIGGGYGQFGILTEEEFLTLIKTPGKRTQKFTQKPQQFRGQFNQVKIHRKDDGIDFITENECPDTKDPEEPPAKRQKKGEENDHDPVPMNVSHQASMALVGDWGFAPELEEDSQATVKGSASKYMKYFNDKLYDPRKGSIPQVDVEELASKRFGYKKQEAPASDDVVEIVEVEEVEQLIE